MDLLKASAQDKQWHQKGVDIWLIRSNLALSYEGRVAQHQNTVDCIAELKQVGLMNRAKLAKSSQISCQQLT